MKLDNPLLFLFFLKYIYIIDYAVTVVPFPPSTPLCPAHPLFLFLRETLLVCAHWVWCWLWVCHIWPLPYMIPVIHFDESFYHKWCLILSNAYSSSIDMMMWFLSLVLLMWHITVIDLWILYHPCIPRINPAWSWCMIFLMYGWIQFPNILLRILASLFIRDILAYNFLSL